MKPTRYHLFLRNFSNPLKLNIIILLKERPLSVNEIAKELKIEQSKVSHALSSLRCCNILLVNKKGKRHIYSLNKRTILPIFKIIENHVKINCKGGCSCI